MRRRRRRTPPFAGGPIANTRDVTVEVPSGRLVFRVHVGHTLTTGSYSEIVFWLNATPDGGVSVGERVWASHVTHPEVIQAHADGTLRAVVAAGPYRYFACWGVLKSPIFDVEVSPAEEVRVDVRFDLGDQPEARPLPGVWETTPETKSAVDAATTVRAVADAVSSVTKALKA